MLIPYNTSCPETTPGIVIAARVAAIHRGAGGVYQDGSTPVAPWIAGINPAMTMKRVDCLQMQMVRGRSYPFVWSAVVLRHFANQPNCDGLRIKRSCPHSLENYMNSFDAHWLNYLARRSKLTTRLLHYFGLVFGQVLGVALAMWFQSWGYLLICPLAYGVAQLSRETIWGAKKNPYITKAVFNIMSFFRMMILDVTGKLRPEIERIQHPR